jgi:hypothetical protein
VGHDQIGIISTSLRRKAADRHRRDQRGVVFLQGESRSECDGSCDRGNHRTFTGTNNARIEPDKDDAR